MATFTIDPPRAGTTEADRLVSGYLASNVRALAQTQRRLPDAIGGTDVPDLAWLFARDGYLTAMEPGDRWHTGCSVPLLAARAMLKTLDRAAGVACFLNPTHAAQVRVVLDQLDRNQAVICLVPDAPTLGVMLRCDDFAGEIAAGRLWFAWGENWADELARLFDEVPGLSSPSRFVRMPRGEEAVLNGLITTAQRVFADFNSKRNSAIADLRERWTKKSDPASRTVCIVARSTFRLWDDAGHTLLKALQADATDSTVAAIDWRVFDADAPAGSSPLSLATAAAASDAVVAAEVSRADVANLVPAEQPWITWVTSGRIPAFPAAGPNDRLLLADARWRDAAARAGWPAERVDVAGWPTEVVPEATGERVLAMIADTCPLDPPDSLNEFSSHLLLWEKLRRTVLRDPFALPDDAEAWLLEQARADDVAVQTLDVPLFVNRLIVPAYQQALAEVLLKAGLPLRLYGKGWDELPSFRANAAGPVTSREDLHDAARSAGALVHAWPNGAAHAIDSLGRPVVRRTGRRPETFVRDARLALTRADAAAAPRPDAPRISAEVVVKALRD